MSFFDRILFIPIGSYEYHGTELPPDTDTVIATRVALATAADLATDFSGQVIVLPSLNYGLAREHVGLPNTAFVTHVPYYTFILDLVRSLALPKTLIVFANGHGGNSQSLGAAESDFNYEHSDCKLFSPNLYPGPVKDLCTALVGEYDAHAGSVEASIMAYYLEREPRQYSVPIKKRVRGSLRFFRTAELTTCGVIKNSPTVIADPDKGRQLHDEMVRQLAQSVRNLIVDLTRALSTP